jgi:hypothetical protein
MAAPLSADRLLRALRDEGLRVIEHRSWRTNNRNHKGPFGPVHGVMIHHTVTSGTMSSVELCYNGHSKLPGPLCHGVIAKDGTVYLVGNGRANHAGLGDDDVLRAVIDERELPPDNEANTDGNRHFYGFECINLGDGKDPWPAAQLEAIEKAAAAICRAHGWGRRSALRHLDWQPGKVDPRGVDWPAMQARIGARLGRPAGSTGTAPPPPPQEESDMKMSDIVTISGWIQKRWSDLADGKISVNTALASGYAHSRAANENTSAILTQLKAQTAAIEKLAQLVGSDVDTAQVVAAVERAIADAVIQVDVDITGAQNA